jgi:hypothetical protein
LSEGRKILLGVLTAAISFAVMLGVGEVLLRAVSPTEYLSPRYQFSREYGMIPFAGVVMVHGVPGTYRYRYTVNSIRSRGEVVEPGVSGLPAVVVLGDSYSFGMGVSDGEEYASVMRRALAGRADVVNLGSPGWGLTQEIRRYYEIGERYHPRIVVLQFCANDPEDNFSNQVTRVRDGTFVFVDSKNSTNWIKKFMSRSPLQRTQVYNFFRTRLSIMATRRSFRRKTAQMEAARPQAAGADHVPVDQALHIELLSAFARRMHEDGVALWVIAVDRQLEQLPHIQRAVEELDARGEIRYVEVMDWLRDHPDHASPEGHLWGTAAHRVIGEHLAAEVAAALADTASMRAP